MQGKIAVVICLSFTLIASTKGDFHQYQRQQQPPSAGAPPYPPSGWKPQGASFTLPVRQQQQFAPPPPNQPAGGYGAPDAAGSNEPESTTYPYNQDVEVENIKTEKLRDKSDQTESVFKNTDRGIYYVYLPDGRLQRVVYTTSADLQNKEYTARVRYEDVDPVSAPIYTALNGAAGIAVAPIAAPIVSAQQLITVQP